jgi:hypothetical protein
MKFAEESEGQPSFHFKYATNFLGYMNGSPNINLVFAGYACPYN